MPCEASLVGKVYGRPGFGQERELGDRTLHPGSDRQEDAGEDVIGAGDRAAGLAFRAAFQTEIVGIAQPIVSLARAGGEPQPWRRSRQQLRQHRAQRVRRYIEGN